MTQSQLPHIWGADWKPRVHLDFESEVEISDVKGELIRFIAERHDGHLRLVSWIFDEVSNEYENTSLDGPAFHLFSESLAQKLQENLSKRAEESGIMATEIIPEEGFSAPFPKVAAICSRCAIVHAPNGTRGHHQC